METIFSVFVPIHKEGYKYIGIFAAVTLIFLWIGLDFLFTASLILTLWCAYFFRDPERVTPQKEGLIIAPADGVVQSVKLSVPPAGLGMGEEECTRVSIFMNVFNCHVNRTPIEATVEEIFYKPGKFLNASLDKSSEENERNYYKIINNQGEEVIVVQIAGLIARRIVCESSKDQQLQQGERIGMIRFGSRADVYFENYETLVKVGQKTIAGETLLAKR